MVAKLRGPYLGSFIPPQAAAKPRKQIARLNVPVTWVFAQPYFSTSGFWKTLQA